LGSAAPTKRPEVSHFAVLPQESVAFTRGRDATAHYLPNFVDAKGEAAISAKCSEVFHLAVLPQ
jgi:hypothetical protein